jgi:lipoprotein-anchoring transpeptidase ErfK/SrfK
MVIRTVGALATLLIGLVGPGGEALAQYSPPPPYPPAQAYPPPATAYPPYRPLPPVEADDEPFYDPPMGARPLPPAPIGPQVYEPPAPPLEPAVRPGRRYSAPIEEAELPPPAGALPPPGYPAAPPVGYREAVPAPVYGSPALAPPPAPVYEPAASATRPYYGVPPAAAPDDSSVQDAMRPPLPITPGPVDPSATGTARGDPRTQFAALPPDVRPETGPRRELPPQFRRTQVDYRTKEPVGTIIIDTPHTYLYLVLGDGKALRYGVGVGREGFTWSGAEKVTRMAEWPDWHPPAEMIERQPYLPRFMAGGEGNPLGARALYLGKTVFRIHGTNQPSTIGTFVSSGCIRLTNEDVTDLYGRVKVGTRVVVLAGQPPAPAPAMSLGPPAAMPPAGPPVSMAPLGPPPTSMAR